jgi:hypothetical protein
MKLTIDTERKIITIQQRVKITDLMQELDNLFPNKEWKDYELDTSVGSTIKWPLYHPEDTTIGRPYVHPSAPPNFPGITYEIN